MSKEAHARIKINKLLETSGWRFEDDEKGKANIQLEPGVKIHDVGDDFENITDGYLDFLLLDKDGKALVVVEAKRESIDPLSAKERARAYARSVNARFIILSNGNIHYFWDTKHGNPETISRFPTQKSISQYTAYIPNPAELAETQVDENYIVASQDPTFEKDPCFQDIQTRSQFLKNKGLKQMRPYQVQAVRSLQTAVRNGRNRFLFEMATGTGKTLVAAAVIKLFLRSGNAKRVLFLVDRLELEEQAKNDFKDCLGKDYTTVVYKEGRDKWQNASIVVSTVQTFLSGDRYKKEFSPTDFEFVISDEAHRSIGGNSRAVFEYFVGYKLGLTATPKDYLKGVESDAADSQKEFERRQLLDTYKTFGCDKGEPTFRYDLIAGVRDGYLINPIVVDARTEITAQLLSKDGYAVHKAVDNGSSVDEIFKERHYEKKLFNEETNIAMCKAFFDNALFDPIAPQYGKQLFGKSLVFCVSQSHASRITNILNKLAMDKWPSEYAQSDFAIQVTSLVYDAQRMTVRFSNNQLSGQTPTPGGYISSKTRVCVTVGMMTTGYNCQDILNIALMRPIFSPSEFIQIKGRGTRKYSFEYSDYETKQTFRFEKDKYKLFDFFASCEYFEKKFNYDEKIKLPHISKASIDDGSRDTTATDKSEYVDDQGNKVFKGPVDLATQDSLESIVEIAVSSNGMRIDREAFGKALEEDVRGNKTLKALWDNGDVEAAEDYTKKHVFDRPKHFLNLDRVRRIFNVDRRITVKEFLEVAFGEKEYFQMKDDLLQSEWEKFQEIHKVEQKYYRSVQHYFLSYIDNEDVRSIIDRKTYAQLNESPVLSFEEFNACNGYKDKVPQYVKDYVPLNTFMN